ncbi:MAG: glycosyltransferase [Phycisphaerae bacterium]|nr:glycosyltransferase [Phycisphaerae bacterium]
MKRPIQVLHVVDSTIGWDQRLAIEQLLNRLPAERFTQQVVGLGHRKGEYARIDAPVKVMPHRPYLDFLTTPRLWSLLDKRRVDLVHAWGMHAISTSLSIGHNSFPIIASVFDPAATDRYSRSYRVKPQVRRLVFACATELVRRYLVEKGVSPEDTVLIRPGVNFSTLNRAKKSNLRSRLGLSSRDVVLLTDYPATRQGGQFCAFWATAVRSFLDTGIKLMLPGDSRETERIRRLACAVGQTAVLVLPGDQYRQEKLIAIADCLLIPAVTGVSVTAIAWAMGAGIPVIASAGRATAELLRHHHNGFLIKPEETKRLAIRFAEAVGQRREWNNLTETARSQAYEVFSLHRCIEQTQNVYENLLANRPPSDGIKDPAIVGQPG